MRTTRVVGVVIAVALLMVFGLLYADPAGERDDEGVTTRTTRTTQPAEPAPWPSCEGDGVVVAYPPGWFVAPSPDGQATCRFFARHPLSPLPPQTEPIEAIDIAVVTGQGGYAEVLAGSRNPETTIVLSSEAVTVDGRRGVAFEVEQKEGAYYDAGTRSFFYVVDHDGSAMVAGTVDLPVYPYEDNKKVLAQMMERIELR